MKNPVEIRNLARQRLHEAEILFSHGKSDGAFYLAGYAAELSLKAKICERLGIPNLLDDSIPDPGETKGIYEIRKKHPNAQLAHTADFRWTKEQI